MLGALALASCAQSARLDPPITATVNTEVLPTKAFISPPPGGPSVIAVLQDTVPNAVTQEIVLSTLSRVRGQNAFHVTLFRRDKIEGNEMDDRELRPGAIRKEMLSRFPSVRMQMSAFYVQNKYGPFGYAVGRAASGELCLYGWQRIVPNKAPSPFFGSAGAISMRLRICDIRATEAALLSLMYGYTVNAYYLDRTWNPYGPPPDVPASIGQIDSPSSPVGQEGMGSVLNGEVGPPAVPAAPQPTVRRRQVQRDRLYSSAAYPAAAVDPYAAGAIGPSGAAGGYPAAGYPTADPYAVPAAGGLRPAMPMMAPPTPLTGYPVVPQPGSN